MTSEATIIPRCQPADPNPRPPRFKAPPGVTDTHFHIFGPEEKYPLVADRRFTPPDASVESYLHLHRTLGLSRAVLVQPSSYGTDNRRQLDAAREMEHRAARLASAEGKQREAKGARSTATRSSVAAANGSLPRRDLRVTRRSG